MKISNKYKPLFAKPRAKDVINSPDFDKLPQKEKDWWILVDSIVIFVITGGRGSGKSFTVELDADIRASQYNHNIYYTRYTNDSLEDTVIADFEKIFELSSAEREVLRNKIDYPKGGQIVFKGLKRGSKSQTAGGKGLSSFNCQIVEEAEEHPSYHEFDKMRLSLRRKDLPNYSILLLNPTTKEHWIYKELFENYGVTGGVNTISDGICYIHTTYLDVSKEHHTEENWNEYERGREHYELYINTPKDERENLDKKTKKYYHWYKHIVLGGWLDKAEGVIFPDWIDGIFPNHLPYVYGLDFGYSPDPCAMSKIAVDNKTKTVYIEELLYKTELSTDRIESEIRRHTNEDDLIIADCAEKRLIIELRSRDINIIPCEKGADSIRKGIKDLQGYDIVVCGNSPNLKVELSNYVWNDKKAGVPIDQYNHLIDGIRYGFTRLNKGFFTN